MKISLIAAVDRRNAIGYQNRLLWHITEDFKWFIKHTTGKPVVMGRATYESIGAPLKDRINIVLSRDTEYKPHPSVIVLHSIEDVLEWLWNEEEVMIIGGANVYTQFLPYADALYLTEIEKEFTADAFFPDYNKEDWIEYVSKKGTESVGFEYCFKIYEKA